MLFITFKCHSNQFPVRGAQLAKLALTQRQSNRDTEVHVNTLTGWNRSWKETEGDRRVRISCIQGPCWSWTRTTSVSLSRSDLLITHTQSQLARTYCSLQRYLEHRKQKSLHVWCHSYNVSTNIKKQLIVFQSAHLFDETHVCVEQLWDGCRGTQTGSLSCETGVSLLVLAPRYNICWLVLTGRINCSPNETPFETAARGRFAGKRVNKWIEWSSVLVLLTHDRALL